MANMANPPVYTGHTNLGPSSSTWSDQPPSNSQNFQVFSHTDTESMIPRNNGKEPEPVQYNDGWRPRDDVINTLNFKQAEFDDVMKQPTSPLTIPGINTFFSLVFTYTQAALYTLLTLITGVILTIAWGLVFSVISFVNIWLIKPAIRLLVDTVTPFGQLYRFLIRTFLDPLFESISQVYAYIRGNFKLSVTGISKGNAVQNV